MIPARAAQSMIRIRRSIHYRPTLLARTTVPFQCLRPITIQASPPSSSDTSDPDSRREPPNFEIVDDAPSVSSTSSFASSSQHPFSSIDPDLNSQANDMSGTNVPARSSTLPPPPILSEVQWTRFQHPFDTHAFVNYLEKAGINTGTSTTLMEAVRKMIVTRSDKTRESMMAKEDMENAAYLFRAALSELRTELSVKARNDGTAFKTMASTIRREVDILDQKIKEDIQTLKHDIEMDMNNRNAENRSELKVFDLSIEEINNKFTISLGDLRTEIESAKWDATRRAISIIATIVVSVVAVTLFVTDSGPATPPTPPASASASLPAPKVTMRDMSVGPGPGNDEELPFDPDSALSEEKLEKILKESGLVASTGLGMGREKRKKDKKEKKETVHQVDRI